MQTSNKHRLEEAAIELEKSQSHCRDWVGGPYPWTDTKVASAFGRAAKILRKALEEAK